MGKTPAEIPEALEAQEEQQMRFPFSDFEAIEVKPQPITNLRLPGGKQEKGHKMTMKPTTSKRSNNGE